MPAKGRPPIDLDLLALAGMTKAGLKEIDKSRVGGNSPLADNINLKKMAGLDNPRRNPNFKAPNVLKGLDFITAPKSMPLGAVKAEDGTTIINDNINFMPIPEDLQKNVQNQLELISSENNNLPTQEKNINNIPNKIIPPNMDFDLFQFSILKDILKKLDSSIDSIEHNLIDLKSKREMIAEMIKGIKNA